MVKEGNFYDYTSISHLQGDVPITRLFSDGFLKEHTKFLNLGELMTVLDADMTKTYSFEELNTEKTNEIIQQSTDFSSLEEMLKEAGEYYMAHNIKF